MTRGKCQGRLMLVWAQQKEKGGKGLIVFGIGVKFKFYLDGLDRVLEAEPIVIEWLNHTVN